MPQQEATYPKPPLAKQQQPWPGLACKTQPPSDRGEASYVGSGRHAGRGGETGP